MLDRRMRIFLYAIIFGLVTYWFIYKVLFSVFQLTPQHPHP
jgi:hypothetical protein